MYFCDICKEDDKKYFIELINYDGSISPFCGICSGIYTKQQPQQEPQQEPQQPQQPPQEVKAITTKSIINNVFNDKIKKTKKNSKC